MWSIEPGVLDNYKFILRGWNMIIYPGSTTSWNICMSEKQSRWKVVQTERYATCWTCHYPQNRAQRLQPCKNQGVWILKKRFRRFWYKLALVFLCCGQIKRKENCLMTRPGFPRSIFLLILQISFWQKASRNGFSILSPCFVLATLESPNPGDGSTYKSSRNVCTMCYIIVCFWTCLLIRFFW